MIRTPLGFCIRPHGLWTPPPTLHLPPDVFFCCPYTHPPTSLSLSSASFFSPHFLFFRELLFYLFLSCGLERKGTHASEQTGPAFSLCTVPTIWCPCNTPIPPWLLTILCQKYSQVETDWNCFFKLTEVWLFINCALLFNPHFSLTITLTILFTLWFFFFFSFIVAGQSEEVHGPRPAESGGQSSQDVRERPGSQPPRHWHWW